MNSLKRSSDCRNQTYALLSIKPQFAASILRGEKRYEFRRSVFSRQVDVVVVYATAPVQRVVVEFDVLSVITAPLTTLWERTHECAGIDEAVFYGYFEGLERGHAIAIGEVRVYDPPFCIVEELGLKPPQSFLYLDSTTRGRTALPKCGGPHYDHRSGRTNTLEWLSPTSAD